MKEMGLNYFKGFFCKLIFTEGLFLEGLIIGGNILCFKMGLATNGLDNKWSYIREACCRKNTQIQKSFNLPVHQH